MKVFTRSHCAMVFSYSTIIILARSTDLKLIVIMNPASIHTQTSITLALECVVFETKLLPWWWPCDSSIIAPMQNTMPEKNEHIMVWNLSLYFYLLWYIVSVDLDQCVNVTNTIVTATKDMNKNTQVNWSKTLIKARVPLIFWGAADMK